MESEFDLASYFSILRRRFWYLVLPFIVLSIGGVVAAFVLPPVYEANATILVESQQIPTDLAASTVTGNISERIQVIEQRLLARDNLLQIASKFSLYDYEGANRTPSTVVDNMREAIVIRQIDASSNSRAGMQVIGFTVAFNYRTASTAAAVTNELVSSILAQNIESRLSRASETSKFLEQQKSEIEQRLLALETKIANYRRENEHALPETVNDRRSRLTTLQAQIDQLDQRIRFAESAAAGGTPMPVSSGARQLGFTLQVKQLELDSLREERERLAPLEEKGYISKNRLSEMDRRISLAEIETESLKAQIADQEGMSLDGDVLQQVKDQRAALSKQAQALSDSILRTPLVEVELNSLNRDYENLQVEYRQAQARYEDAATGERLEQDRQAERFEVIEQAVVPTEPSSPDRPRVIIGGLFGGLAGGVGLLILRQLLDKAVYRSADLERKLQLQAIVTIPYVVTEQERRRKTRNIIIVLVLTIAAVAALLVAIDMYYLPLDVLAERLTERLRDLLVQFGLLH